MVYFIIKHRAANFLSTQQFWSVEIFYTAQRETERGEIEGEGKTYILYLYNIAENIQEIHLYNLWSVAIKSQQQE